MSKACSLPRQDIVARASRRLRGSMKKLFAACVISAVAYISAVNAQGFPNKMIPGE
jgi:hypothetical protein